MAVGEAVGDSFEGEGAEVAIGKSAEGGLSGSHHGDRSHTITAYRRDGGRAGLFPLRSEGLPWFGRLICTREQARASFPDRRDNALANDNKAGTGGDERLTA